jgi:hypothetical protein
VVVGQWSLRLLVDGCYGGYSGDGGCVFVAAVPLMGVGSLQVYVQSYYGLSHQWY